MICIITAAAVIFGTLAGGAFLVLRRPRAAAAPTPSSYSRFGEIVDRRLVQIGFEHDVDAIVQARAHRDAKARAEAQRLQDAYAASPEIAALRVR